LVIENEYKRLAKDILTEPSSPEDSLSDESDISEVSVLDLITWSCQPKHPYKKDTKSKRPLSRESRINVVADEIAFDATQIASEGPIPDLPPVLEPPFMGTKAMLTVGKV